MPGITKVRDFYLGAERVKSRRETYLPPPESIAITRADEQVYRDKYASYLCRAEVPAYVADAVERQTGMMHAKPPSITLPPRLEYLREDATGSGESLANLLRSINAEQLLSGRVGLAVDVGPDGPVIRLYYAEAVRNWHAPGGQYSLVVLGEQHDTIGPDLVWESTPAYRVLTIGEDGNYQTALYDANGGQLDPLVTPSVMGRAYAGAVPFVAINCSDISPDMDRPPLLPLAEKCAAIYRLDADHKMHLHMQSASTLVVSGLIASESEQYDEDGNRISTQRKLRVGAGAYIETEIGGSAQYASPGAAGLAETREALDALHRQAAAMGVDVLGAAGAGESGDALTARVSARAASLVQIARAGAAGLERALRYCAIWVGADPASVSVVPYTDYRVTPASASDALTLMQAKVIGAPISIRSIHEWAQANGFTRLDYSAEMDEIANEGP